MHRFFLAPALAFAGCVAYVPPTTPTRVEAVRARAGQELGCAPDDVRVEARPDARAGSYFTYAVSACGTSATYTCRQYREPCWAKGCVSPLELSCIHDASPSFEGVVRKKAARDLSCEEVTLRPRPDVGVATFDAAGCGASGRYACFETSDAASTFHVTCRGRPTAFAPAAPATWGTSP
jgi:hypothetical protein